MSFFSKLFGKKEEPQKAEPARHGGADVVGRTNYQQKSEPVKRIGVDVAGRTNYQRMVAGLRPVGKDGRIVVLHIIDDHGGRAEMLTSKHHANFRALHMGLDRGNRNLSKEVQWSIGFWKMRAKQIQK